MTRLELLQQAEWCYASGNFLMRAIAWINLLEWARMARPR